MRRVLIDPATRRVTGFVVSTSRLFGRDVNVGEGEFAMVSPDAVTLALTRDELERAPSFAERDHTVPPLGWAAPIGYGYPADLCLVPLVCPPAPIDEPGTPRSRAATR